MKAVVTLEGKQAGIQERDIPEIKSDEVLVKVIAVALNPTDWKHLEFFAPAGVVMGCDLSGIVEKVGSDVKHVKIGEKVGALVWGSKYTHTGAFAEYSAAVADLCWKKPEHLSHEQNATFGVGSLTAIAVLFQRLALATPAKPVTPCAHLLVWSGATSVGQFAIQYAKLAGYTVVTTASPKNAALMTSLGAAHVFDYRDPDVVNKIKQVTGNKLQFALDCISEKESQEKVIESIGEKGGRVVVIGMPIKEISRPDVELIHELLYTAMGQEFSIFGRVFPAAPQDRAFIRDFINKEFNQLLQDKKVEPNVLSSRKGGLSEIAEGLKYLKSGQASAEKLVYHVQDE